MKFIFDGVEYDLPEEIIGYIEEMEISLDSIIESVLHIEVAHLRPEAAKVADMITFEPDFKSMEELGDASDASDASAPIDAEASNVVSINRNPHFIRGED